MTSPLVGKSWGRGSPSDIANNVMSHMAVHHQGHALRCCIPVAHFGAATARTMYKSAILMSAPPSLLVTNSPVPPRLHQPIHPEYLVKGIHPLVIIIPSIIT
jgi:hypothetical protein